MSIIEAITSLLESYGFEKNASAKHEWSKGRSTLCVKLDEEFVICWFYGKKSMGVNLVIDLDDYRNEGQAAEAIVQWMNTIV